MLYIGGWPPSKGTKLQIYVTGRSFKLQFVTLAPLSQDSQQAANFCHRPVTNLKFFVTGRAPSYTFFSQARHQPLNLWHLHFVTSQAPDSPCTSQMCSSMSKANITDCTTCSLALVTPVLLLVKTRTVKQ